MMNSPALLHPAPFLKLLWSYCALCPVSLAGELNVVQKNNLIKDLSIYAEKTAAEKLPQPTKEFSFDQMQATNDAALTHNPHSLS